MGDVMNVTMQTPIEIALGVDENGMTTARKLYEFLELAPQNYSRWCISNITENKFAEENVDYFYSSSMRSEQGRGNFAQDYKLTSKFARKLSMTQKNHKGEIARDYFATLEDKAKEVAINRSQLPSSLQVIYAMVDELAGIALEQKRQAEQINRIEEKQNLITETFQKPSDKEDFKVWVKRCIARIVDSENFAFGVPKKDKYALAWNESYERLNDERPCRLKQRVKTAQGEALQNGATPSKAKEINALTIIAADKDLKPIYEKVIKEMVSYYCIN